MEFLKLVRRRSFLSEAIYMVLNVALAIALLIIIRYTESIPLALAVVLVSKWRVLAVRPRYWLANIRSNLVDIIVSVSVVIHMYTINAAAMEETTKLMVLVVLTILYIAWLLFLKPRSKRSLVATQAGVAVFLGVSALFTVSFNWPVSIVVLVMSGIGYAVARHVLTSYDDETHSVFLSVAWATVFAEIGWVAYHWTIAYSIPFMTALLLPQVAIITTLVSFLAYKAYDSFHHHQKIRTQDILLPTLFSLSIIIVLITVFNQFSNSI